MTIFYHIAVMHHWREIVTEQFRVLARFGVTDLRVGFSGHVNEWWFAHRVAARFGLAPTLLLSGSGNHNFEFPTLERLQGYCAANPDARVGYLHTKGASKPGDWTATMWRWFMQAHLFQPEAAALLEQADWVAPVASAAPLLHPCGNFWFAKASHINRLANLQDFRRAFVLNFGYAIPKWWGERHAAEMWLGSVAGEVAQVSPGCNISSRDFWVTNPAIQEFVTLNGI